VSNERHADTICIATRRGRERERKNAKPDDRWVASKIELARLGYDSGDGRDAKDTSRGDGFRTEFVRV
jgi:hypothetical protein